MAEGRQGMKFSRNLRPQVGRLCNPGVGNGTMMANDCVIHTV